MYDKASGESSSSSSSSPSASASASAPPAVSGAAPAPTSAQVAGCQTTAGNGTALPCQPSIEPNGNALRQQLVVSIDPTGQSSATKGAASTSEVTNGTDSHAGSAALTPVGDADTECRSFLSDVQVIGPEALFKRVDDSAVLNRDAFALQMLPGEYMIRVVVDPLKKNKMALTSYRLIVTAMATCSTPSSTETFAIVPARSIDAAQAEDQGLTLAIGLKDGRTLRHSFSTPTACSEWVSLLSEVSKPPENLRNDLPACRYFAYMRYEAECLLHRSRPTAHSASDSESVSRRNGWPSGSNEASLLLDLTRTLGLLGSGGWPSKNGVFDAEVKRLEFAYERGGTWRITQVNSDYHACATYPPLHVVPAEVADSVLTSSAGYRTNGRFPSVVWRSRQYGTVLMRASQPCVGVSLFSNKYAPADQQLVKGVLEAVQKDRARMSATATAPPANRRQLLIFDCRDSLATGFNQLVNGGGTERVGDYDPNGTFAYGYLPNVPKVLGFFCKLRARCASALRDAAQIDAGTSPAAPSATAFGDLEWIRTIGDLLTNANRVATALVDEQISVLVHCSDGWDRTPQLIALAKLLVDPHYRSIVGFATLVERDFIDYGHKFAERCGHDVAGSRHAERSPIFVQFLDCVFQLLSQNPTEFEFTESLLLKLAYHVYSCLFGTFLANSRKERDEQFRESTLSVWSLLIEPECDGEIRGLGELDADRPCWKYVNAAYRPTNNVLRADTSNIQLWRSLYLNRAGRFADGSVFALAAPNAALAVSTSDRPCSSAPVPFAAQNLAAAGSGGSSGPNSASTTTSSAGTDNTTQQSFDSAAPADTIVPLSSDVSSAALVAPHSQQASSPIPIGRFGKSSTSALPRTGSSPSLARSLSEGKLSLTLMSYEASPTSPRDFSALAKREREASRSRIPAESGSSMHHTSLSVEVQRGAVTTIGAVCSSPSLAPAATARRTVVNRLNRRSLRLVLEEIATGTSDYLVDADGLLLTVSRADATLELKRLDALEVFEEKQREIDSLRRALSERDDQLLAANNVRSARQAAELLNRLRADGAQCNSVDSSLMNMSLDDEPTESDAVAAVSGRFGIANGDRERARQQVPPLVNSTSWEQIDAREAPLTRWVPNHAAPHCAGCFTSFSLINRKHHCRRCGLVFCANCSSYFVRLPELNSTCDERVCKKCYLHTMRAKAADSQAPTALTSAPSLLCAVATNAHAPTQSYARFRAPAGTSTAQADSTLFSVPAFVTPRSSETFAPQLNAVGRTVPGPLGGSVDSMYPSMAVGGASSESCLFDLRTSMRQPRTFGVALGPLMSGNCSPPSDSVSKLSNGSLANGTSSMTSCRQEQAKATVSLSCGMHSAPIAVVSAVPNRSGSGSSDSTNWATGCLDMPRFSLNN